MNSIVLATVILAALGLICGVALALAARFFTVHEDPRIERVAACLPGINCGGCGFAGCEAYAQAIVRDGVTLDQCAPGGADTVSALAAVMGVDAQATAPRVAFVLCGGDDQQAVRRARYNGITDCAAAAGVDGGDKGCAYGCLGYGSCARVCPVDAITITDARLAVVDPVRCIGCGRCVPACPRSIIRMVPAAARIHVRCASPEKGAVVRKLCKVGCIGCRVCAKLSPDSIRMEGTLAVVDYDRPPEDPQLASKCPTHCIHAS